MFVVIQPLIYSCALLNCLLLFCGCSCRKSSKKMNVNDKKKGMRRCSADGRLWFPCLKLAVVGLKKSACHCFKLSFNAW